MGQKFKILAAAIIPFCLFCVHVVSTVLYNIPENPTTKTYMPFVNGYMGQLFSQNWHLFAPEPATRMVKLWYRVKINNGWQHWQDPMEPVLEKHRHNRATYNAKLLYIYGNIAKDLIVRQSYVVDNMSGLQDSTARQLQQNDSLKASLEYQLALRFVTRDIEKGYSGIPKPDSLQLMLAQLYPKQFSERLSPKPFSYAETIELVPDLFRLTPLTNE
jgi:Family of unknown function (DUF5819)